VSAVDLYAELQQAAFAVRQCHLDRLRSLGVPVTWPSEGTYPFGVVHCERAGGGLYQPLPGAGALHVILPVVEEGALVDLVAFRSTAPDEWLLRTGNGTALGLERGVGWHTWGQSAHLFGNPLDWMQGAGQGLCVVNWSAPDLAQLDVLPCVTVSDPATGALLIEALRRPVRVPQIKVLEGAAHVLAA
jgi:hypothetical protein